jgi:hypothetical protein
VGLVLPHSSIGRSGYVCVERARKTRFNID